ncbi:phage tail tape measure protein [Zhihengliuella flava]|uniref:TP901 family phage tail tape measure protein n=1 Tax=Zhihengliuella flava TaxID=1285193 RepID=A0A931DBF5_9MICC|nr:phage tail tape measure protein [Zhihengliuella flava]MBG6085809.1 TP901 family phage tail tape measure protein [Zhihengliuella flava]
MAERRVKVILEAQVDRYKSAMSAAAKSTEELEKAAKNSGDTTAKRVQALRDLETPLLAIGTASVAGLGLSTKAAMDWESAWAGVMKTVDGTPGQMAEIEDGLRELARTLPSTHTEIAAVAEAAGQLGVARENVVGFTETMINLGESTNLTAEEAATSIAQISNVMGTMEREGSKGVERFGATLVELGNNGASTEADILNMAQRIAGAGATIGATESDVLALSNTLASMGVRAELGGGVATRVLLKMRTAVDEGGESLSTFAQTAGLSADEFAEKFRTSPMEALQLVAGGINNVNEAGGNVTATLKDMGIRGTEETQVMLALANSGDLLTRSLEMGADAWEKNTALVEEAQKRYETTESRIRIAWNNIKDAAITAGGAILPVVAELADGAADLVRWFSELPEPVQIGVTALGGIAGVSAGALGLFLNLAPKVKNAKDALDTFAPAASRSGRALRRIAAAGGAVTVIGGVATGLAKLAESQYTKDIPEGTGHIADALARIATEGANAEGALEAAFQGYEGIGHAEESVSGFDASVRALFGDGTIDKMERWAQGGITAITGVKGSVALAEEAFKAVDAELATMVSSGNIDAAKSAMETLAGRLEESGVSAEDASKLFPQYADALRHIEADSATAAEGSEDLEGAIGEVGDAAGDAADELDAYFEGLTKTGAIVLTERAAHRELADSIRSATESIKENGATLDINTEKGSANQAALDGIASATDSVRTAMYEAGATSGEMAAEVQKGRDAFINAAIAAGMEEDAAGALADQMGLIPADVFTEYESNADGEISKISDLHTWIQSTPDKKITITDNSPVTVKALRDLGYIVTELPDGRIQVSETGTDETGAKIDATAGKKRTAKIDAQAITSAAEAALNAVARDRTSRVTQTIHTNYTSTGTRSAERLNYGQARHSTGGRTLRRYSDGGRLPETGLGTDQILGIGHDGHPTAWVDDREWVINRASSDKYNRELAMINNGTFPKLPGFADGGRLMDSTTAAPVMAGRSVTFQQGAIVIQGVRDENVNRVLETTLEKKLEGLR